MGTASPLDLHRLDRLLFVTSGNAILKLTATLYGKREFNHLRVVAGNRLVTLTGRPPNIQAAVKAMRAKIPHGLAIDGVVIIGDYKSVPSRRLQVISDAEIGALKKANYDSDDDLWCVWTDDLYGDLNADGYGEKPVSRLPIIPTVGGILGDRPAPAGPIPAFNGFRSEEFNFADDPYRQFLAKDPAVKMAISPPKKAYRPNGGQPGSDDLVSGRDIAADLVYLPLHSSSDKGARFFGDLGGMSTTTINPKLLDIKNGEWQTRGVVFSGACWGALIATAAVNGPEPLEAWTAKESIALTFVDRGANAYVGFTALHYVEKDGHPRGSSLHGLFWANVVERGLPPAKALLEARTQFMVDSSQETDPLVRATTLKTFWSATCLGLGW